MSWKSLYLSTRFQYCLKILLESQQMIMNQVLLSLVLLVPQSHLSFHIVTPFFLARSKEVPYLAVADEMGTLHFLKYFQDDLQSSTIY